MDKLKEYQIDTNKQRDVFLKFWDRKQNVADVYRAISHNEWCINSDKAQRAYDRKVERIDNLVAELPLVPDGTEEWIKNNVFKEQYMFYCKESDRYMCTACGKPHHFKRKIKHNESVLCKRTNVWAEVKKRNVIRQERTEHVTVCVKI